MTRLRSSDRSPARYRAALRPGLCAAFIAAVATPPLYFQNQNTKFLHGLAAAFPERLGADWTAGTVDGLPVFSALVHGIAAFADPVLFYLVEAALLALMCLSFLAIARLAAPGAADAPAFLLLAGAVLVTLVHPIQKDSLYGVAEQYMMRGYLQPSEFGILYLPAILLAARRHRAALPLMALPAAIHPGYLLLSAVGGAILLWDRWRQAERYPPWLLAAVALLLVLPPLDLMLRFAPSDGESFARANRILAFERIPHHSDPLHWADVTTLRKLALALLALVLAPAGVIRALLAGFLAVAIAGSVFVALTGNAEIALMAPWRASIIVVPLSFAIVTGWGLGAVLRRISSDRLAIGLSVAAALWALALAADGVATKWRDLTGPRASPAVLHARASFAPGTLYLTPPDMAEFRLAAMVPQFVTRKTHPYLDREVIEWDRRLGLAERVFPEDGPIDCSALRDVRAAYPVTHILVPRDAVPASPCDGLSPEFEAEGAVIFKVATAG